MSKVIVQPRRHARLLGFAGRFGATLVIVLHSPAIVDGRHLYKDTEDMKQIVALYAQTKAPGTAGVLGAVLYDTV
jgi:hypothetical protein